MAVKLFESKEVKEARQRIEMKNAEAAYPEQREKIMEIRRKAVRRAAEAKTKNNAAKLRTSMATIKKVDMVIGKLDAIEDARDSLLLDLELNDMLALTSKSLFVQTFGRYKSGKFKTYKKEMKKLNNMIAQLNVQSDALMTSLTDVGGLNTPSLTEKEMADMMPEIDAEIASME